MNVKVNFDGEWLGDRDLKVFQLSYNERMKRGIQAFAFFFALALGAVLIPVMHFVLVPSLLIAAAYFSRQKFKEVSLTELHELVCPKCQKSFDRKQAALKLGETTIRLLCPSCRKNMTLVISDPAI